MTRLWILCAVASLSAAPATAASLNAQSSEPIGEGGQIATNALITAEGRGDVFVHRITVADAEALGVLLGKGLAGSCTDGQPVAFELRNVTFSADPDALPEGMEAETVYAELAYGTLDFAPGCVALSAITARNLDARAVTGDAATAASAQYSDTGGMRSAEIKDLRVVSDAGVEVLTASRLGGSYARDGQAGSAVIEQASIVPAQFFYPDVLTRLALSDAQTPMSGNLTAEFSLPSGLVKISAHADRVADLDVALSATGVGGNAMTGLFRSADVSFADAGLLAMYAAWTGASLSDELREGTLRGLPGPVQGESFAGIRAAVADWLDAGGGSVQMRPGLPVPLAALGAAAMLSPDRAVGMLGIQAGLQEQKENP